MERINITKLDLRGTMLIVGIEGKEDHTMNTGWQKAAVDFLLNEVGVGGSVEVELEATKPNPKGGFYKNIKTVLVESAQKSDTTMTSDNPIFTDTKKELKWEVKPLPNPQRVGLFIKLAVEMMVAAPQEGKTVEENLCENIQEIQRLEEFTIKLLG